MPQADQTTRPNRIRLPLAIALILASALAATLYLHSRKDDAISILNVSGPDWSRNGAIRIEAINGSEHAASNVYFVIRLHDAEGKPITDSLSCRQINGPWIGNVRNDPGAIQYTGQKSVQGNPILTYALASHQAVRCEFFLDAGFEDRFARPERVSATVMQLPRPGGTTANPIFRHENRFMTLMSTVRAAVTFLKYPLPMVCSVPWIACLVILLLRLITRKAPAGAETRRGPLAVTLVDAALLAVLVIGTTSIFLQRIEGKTPGRDSDTFDYLSIAERFGPCLDDCIKGMMDRGYSRREYLHQVLDRSWGYPLLLSTVARFSGDPCQSCGTFLHNMQKLNVALLLMTCSLVAWIVYRFWTPSLLPLSRSGFVYGCMIFDGYNVHSANRLLTEVPSRFIFSVCLLAGLSFWNSTNPKFRQAWLVIGTFAAFAAMMTRAEHSLVETAIMPGLLLLQCRQPHFKRSSLTWLVCMLLGASIIVSTSYAKYGVLRPTTATGLHLFNVVYRLPKDGGVHTQDMPPGVVMSTEEESFFRDYIIPAGRTAGGAVDPYMALPGIIDMEPLALTRHVQRLGWGILKKNKALWVDMVKRRYPGFASRSNWIWPGPFTEPWEKLINTFGAFSPFWGWPLVVSVWLLGRWLWGRLCARPMRSAPLLLFLIAACFYWHLFIITCVGAGEERHSYFATGFIPMLGSLVVLDSLGLTLASLRHLLSHLNPMQKCPASCDNDGAALHPS